MKRKIFDPKECIGPLNTVKHGLQMQGKSFTKETILNALKNCGLPTNCHFWTVFRKAFLQEIKRGRYMFTSKEPIYIGSLYSVRDNYRSILKGYSKAKKAKQEEEQIVEAEIINSDFENDIQKAIELLKDHGYQILKPIGIIYERVH